ncbi:MAG: efflux transporter outer membrane subunit [Acidobacteria bacterium]|nr:efflux transporter outer membrane subunit [Acidobacteriota bacterium]
MRALALLVLLVGCAPKHLDIDAEMPANYDQNQTPSIHINDSWWQDFNAPELNQIMELALADNPGYAASAARLRAAAAQAQMFGAERYPEVALGLSGTRRKQNFIGFPIPGTEDRILSSTSEIFTTNLSVSWELDLWGRVKNTTLAATQDAESAYYDHESFRLALIGQVIRTYLAWVETEQRIDLTQTTVDGYRHTRDQVFRRYERGMATSLDARLAQTNVAQSEARVTELKQVAAIQKNTLSTLSGRFAPNDFLSHPNALPSMLGPVPAGLPAELIQRRPDIAAAEARLRAAFARHQAAIKLKYPRFSLTGSLGTSSNQLHDLVNMDAGVWQLIGNLVQPIFQGGRIKANIAIRAAELEGAEAKFRESLIQAYNEVHLLITSEKYLESQVTHLAEASDQATKAQVLAEARYRNGIAPYVTVLEAQRRALQSQSDLIASRRSLLEHRVNLYLALGGGFKDHVERTPQP